MKSKHILLIPPEGQFKKQDFSLQRIGIWLSSTNKTTTTLLYIKNEHFNLDISMFTKIIEVNSKDALLEKIKEINYDLLFHRSWMTSYEFAARLVKDFNNVVINIKDWNFADQDVYRFLYPDIKDHEGINFIFKNCKKILSHFTKEQALTWGIEFNIDKNKFIHFPEYCNPKSFNNKPSIQLKNIYLVYAGAIPFTTLPEDYFPGKAHLRSIKKLTKQGLFIDFVLPEKVYDTTINSKELYKDFLYENKMNKKFNIIKGEALNSAVLNKYHFGFFELEATGLNHDLYKYAITSKFAFYLESGLPILINDRFISISKLVKKHNLGIVFNNNELSKMESILNISQTKYDSFIESIKKYRKKFIYNNKKLKKLGL